MQLCLPHVAATPPQKCMRNPEFACLYADNLACCVQASAVRCDVRVKSEVEGMVAHAVSTYGQLDIMVANAGIVKAAPFLEITEQDFDDGELMDRKSVVVVVQSAD